MEQSDGTRNHRGTVDGKLFRDVTELYLDLKSIKQVSRRLGISEVKVRRILLTEGLWRSTASMLVQHYLDQGCSTQEIAEMMRTTVKAVQQYLPYSRGVYGGENPSPDAVRSRDYRKRVISAQERVLRKNQEMASLKERRMQEQEMAMLNGRRMQEQEMDMLNGWKMQEQEMDMLKEWKMQGKRDIHGFGLDVVRLHLEWQREGWEPGDFEDDGHRPRKGYGDSAEEERVLRAYGQVKYGSTISRDILVPGDMPLYALHYVIQRLFGWQNSHMHRFCLPLKRFLGVTGNAAGNWSKLVGVLFRSPWMDEEDQFWADDYVSGSFLKWIRKKYTGPFVSLCHGEGIIQCDHDVQAIKRRCPRILLSWAKSELDGRLYISDASPVQSGYPLGEVELTEDEKNPPTDSWKIKLERKEVVRFDDCPAEALNRLLTDGDADSVLERLEIGEVLALHGNSLEDELPYGEEILDSFEKFMDEDLIYDIHEILKSGRDEPLEQPVIGAPTDVLYYFYDFGDGWTIRIAGSLGARDLVERGRVSQSELDLAIQKVHETYRPVCIAADGLPLVDDAGGADGYISFLRALNPSAEKTYWGEKERMPDNGPYENKTESLRWAKSLGWKDKVNPKTLL